MVTIRDVAARAGVSVATVSHVINGTRKVAPSTAERVCRAIEELGYQPNSLARGLRTRVTQVIGVLVSDITNPFFATLVRGVEDAARDAGYSVIICNSDEDPEKEDHYIRVLWQRRVDGLLIVPTRDGTSPAIRDLIKKKVPFVFIDRKAKDIQADAVLSDNVNGAYQAVKHLVEHGHRRIGIVLGIPGATTTEERFAGYCLALQEAGLVVEKELVKWGGYRFEGGQKAMTHLLNLSQIPTAVFSVNNQMTLGILAALRRQNVKIPQEIAVVGFDDSEWAEFMNPPLTVVAQQPYKLGYEATNLLLYRLTHPDKPFKEIRIETILKIRGSA
ncbi:MAG: LacI family DNA-binding transcriptional regulator [Candidatus Bipolaricaulaceae bacterium]